MGQSEAGDNGFVGVVFETASATASYIAVEAMVEIATEMN
jgi:hypothetical protein